MLKPLNGRVLVKPDEKETQTEYGIILTDAAVEKPLTGTVVSTISDLVAKGDRVLFSRYGYDEAKVDGEDYYIVSENQILGILS